MSGKVTTTERKDLRRIVTITLAALAIVIAGAVGLMAYAAASVDRVQTAREQQLAEVRVARMLEDLTENINSSAIWNDSVITLAGEPDLEWLQINFGDYYADFMGHAVTLVYDRRGDLILASRDSEPVALASEQAFVDAVTPLVAQVRRESDAKRDRPRAAFEASVNRTAIVRAGADIYLVGLGTVVPEDMSTPRLSTDPIIVSAKPISVLLASLEKDLALQAPALADADAPRDDRGGIVLEGPDGAPLTQVLWTPADPGRSVLLGAAPVIGAVILLLAAVAVALFFRISRIVRRLEENEEALTDARDRAEAANGAKSRFLAVMSHELRTPLNGVLGMAQVLAMGNLDAKQRSQLGVLQQSGESLLELIERILTVARLEKGELVSQPAGVDVGVLIEAIAAEHRPAADAAGLALETVVDSAVNGVWRLDGGYVRQALNHLLDNAIRHTSRGAIRLESRATGKGLEFRIIDTGVGIAPERLPDLFGKFVQADDSSTRSKEGAGVGLTLARGLVEAMGGTVRAMSTPGLGSTFVIDLPAERVQVPRQSERQAA
ncbi:sensor histidine kinase [Brevundimonas sp.]|uniref:sensor histidine kinase n=1 Tax=Brevundimonas sp. TaxID=1871086 RepID=UPI002B7C6347|nr:ATP-binding protein [Brevundimonas sp.]HWQ86463.1 ATP-binding protein [Brevundimonas sp.]